MAEFGSMERPARKPDSVSVDRTPPSDILAEQGVLGCILLSNPCINTCIEKFKDGAQVFYDLRNRSCYEAMLKMWDKRLAIDAITLGTELRNANQLEAIGGMAYISALPDATPTAANIVHYVDTILQKYLLRRYINVCSETVSRIYEHEGDVDGLIAEVEKKIVEVGHQRYKSRIQPTAELVAKALQDFDRYISEKGKLTGIPSGFVDLDNLTWGFQAGDYIIIAGRPSLGKSSLVMNIAEFVAVNMNQPVGVFSFEMTAASLISRMIAARARINLRNFMKGFASEAEWKLIIKAAQDIRIAPLYIEDACDCVLSQIRSKASRMVNDFGAKLLIFDYLQLIHLEKKQRIGKNRQEEMADISMGIKSMGKELKVPLIVVSQLNRSVEKEKKKRPPTMADIKESGAVEQDADVIGLLYAPDEDDENDMPGDGSQFRTEDRATRVILNIAKQRSGPTGHVNLIFLKSYTKFESVAKVEEKDMPQPEPADNVVPMPNQTNMPYPD